MCDLPRRRCWRAPSMSWRPAGSDPEKTQDYVADVSVEETISVEEWRARTRALLTVEVRGVVGAA